MQGLYLARQDCTLMENNLVVFHRGRHARSRQETARKDQLRQRVFDPALDRSFERPCAVHRVVTHRDQLIQRFAAQFQLQLTLSQATAQAAQLDLRDASNLIPGQRLEDHHFVDRKSVV